MSRAMTRFCTSSSATPTICGPYGSAAFGKSARICGRSSKAVRSANDSMSYVPNLVSRGYAINCVNQDG